MNGTAIRDRVKRILHSEPLNPQVEYLCRFLMRSFDYGRHGRYLESLRNDAVYRSTWRPNGTFRLNLAVVGRGAVEKESTVNSAATHEVLRLTAAPEPGWVFAGWEGSLSGRHNPASVVLDSDKEVTATFTQSP